MNNFNNTPKNTTPPRKPHDDKENVFSIRNLSGLPLPSPIAPAPSPVPLKRNVSQMMQITNQQVSNQMNMLQNQLYNQQLWALCQMYRHSMAPPANNSGESGIVSDDFDDDSDNEKDNETVFMTVNGRLSILGNKKYVISVAEVNRRLGRPEMLNQSILCGILRKAKNKEGAEELLKNLAQHGINLAQGRRKNAPVTTLTSFCEEEAQELVKDFKNIAEKSFPRKAIAYDILNRQKTEAEIKRKQVAFSRAQKAVNTMVDIFELDNSPVCGQPTNRPSQLHPKVQEAFTHFSLITHGMGPAIHKESWKILSATLGECAKAFSDPHSFSDVLKLPTPVPAAAMSSTPSLPESLRGLFPPIPPLIPFRPPIFKKPLVMYAQLKRTSTTSPALSVDTKLQSGSADLVLKNKKDPKNVKLTVEKPLKAENKLEPSSSIAVTDNDIRDYAQSIGINPDTEPEFMKIAEQGFTQPLDPAWRAVPTDLGDCYFVHRLTGQATWEHPMDDHYREIVRKLRVSKDSSNQNSSTLLERPSSSGSDDHAVLSDAFSSDNELSSDSVTFGSPEACKSASPSSSSGAKKVTFRDELVEVREFDSPNKIQSPHRLDLFNQNTNTQHENNKLSGTGFFQTEQCYRLIQIQRRSELIIQRNWRELCNALTESYSKSLQLSSAVASSSFEPLSSTTSN